MSGKFFDQLLIFVNLHEHVKNRFIPPVYSSDTVSFRVPKPDWPCQFLTKLTQKNLNHLLIYVNFCQHAKNQSIPSVHSGDTVNFWVQRPNWPHPFWPCPTKRFSINFWFLWICTNKQSITLFNQFVLEKWLI